MRYFVLLIGLGLVCGCGGTGGADDGGKEAATDKEAAEVTAAETGPEDEGFSEENAADSKPGSELPAEDSSEYTVGSNFDTTATGWISGDVLEAAAPDGKVLRMKLYGVAAPAEGHPFFEKATARLKFLTVNKPLHIRVRKVLPDGRFAVDVKVPPGKTKAAVILPPVRINNQLVRWGYARHDKDEAPDDEALLDYHASAKQKRRGLWDEDEPPAGP